MNRSKLERRDIVRTFYLRKLLTQSGSLRQDEWELALADNRSPLDLGKPLTIVLVRLDRYEELVRSKSEAELRVYPFAVANIAEEILSRHYACDHVELKEGLLALLVNGAEAHSDSDSDPQADEARLLGCLREIRDTVHGYYHFSFTCAVSETIMHGEPLSDRYAAVSAQLDGRLMYGHGAVVTPGMRLAQRSDYDLPLLEELHRRIERALIEAKLPQLAEALDAFMNELARYDYDGVVQHLLQLLPVIRHTVQQMDQHRVQTFSLNYGELFKTVMSRETLDDAKTVLLAALADLIEEQKPRTDVRRGLLVEAIKEIVQESYMDPGLNLSGIAGMIRMSESYAGKLFRDHEKMSVGDYVNAVRLEHAKRLLVETNSSVNSVMEQTGFSNQSNFFRLFKRHFGATPKELRLTASGQLGK
ncbi:helix-turn-helix transcriptional regulator [Cohnella sp. GCM10012308]|uniref:helix-turn-helix transcriptional regulator n=1 Tax=Cohnella sp. GCM10012308 TaxID=3317329 RepID=UPI003624055A